MSSSASHIPGSILVTGGAGYIGSHCVRQLRDQGREVVVVDDLSTGFERFVLTPHFYRVPIHDAAQLGEIMKAHRVSAVMHFAANAYVGESVGAPEKYYRNNVTGTLQLLSAMTAAGVKRLIFSSTCAVYGTPAQLPITEDTPLAPINPYGKSKQMAETMIADFAAAYGLRFIALRYFNAAGADPGGQLGEAHEPETHLIPLVLQVASGRRKSLTIFGNDYPTEDGTCIRDYVHILDIAQAHLKSLDALESGGPSAVYNIGTGQGFSVRQIIETAEAVTGQRIAHQIGPRRPGDPPILIASAERLKQALGWTPRYRRLSDIISTAWAWEAQEARRLADNSQR